MSRWHLAQLNVARLRHPIDAPQTRDFVDALDPINALAEASPGYVWRLQDESGNATGIPFGDDPDWIANLTVWESIETLRDFTYRSEHVGVLRRRGVWFEALDDAHLVLWWIPAGTIPTIEEAADRLERLRREGPSAEAFTFGRSFERPS